MDVIVGDPGSARLGNPKALSIRELPRSERPRERLKGLGAHALSAYTELKSVFVAT